MKVDHSQTKPTTDYWRCKIIRVGRSGDIQLIHQKGYCISKQQYDDAHDGGDSIIPQTDDLIMHTELPKVRGKYKGGVMESYDPKRNHSIHGKQMIVKADLKDGHKGDDENVHKDDHMDGKDDANNNHQHHLNNVYEQEATDHNKGHPPHKNEHYASNQSTNESTLLSVSITLSGVLFLALIGLVWYIKKKVGGRDGASEPTATTTSSAASTRDSNYYKKVPDLVSDINGDTEEYHTLNRMTSIERREVIFEKLACTLYNGDTSKLNNHMSLNEQLTFIPYNPNREMDRKYFTIGDLLGSGNFGIVHKGEARGLFYPESRTTVAIKSIRDPYNKSDVDSFVAEMKILSNLDLHCNLVNMIASHSSRAKQMQNMWLLLDYCQEGDLKSFLIKHRKKFKNSFIDDRHSKKINSRLLIKWSYHIGKGMEYLASKRIIHGDLAARNVLISGGNKGSDSMVAKVSDFGLSKQLLEKHYYRKLDRNDIPWKWMAFEVLDSGVFDMKSDVWSYGVVIWELFSLGSCPYGQQGYDEVYEKLKNGYHLPCPDDVSGIECWSAGQFYDNIAEKCFALEAEEEKRCSFPELVRLIKLQLKEDELKEYDEITNVYLTKSNFLLDGQEIKKAKRGQGMKKSKSECGTKSHSIEESFE